ncbi:MAG TPA: clostripain-related cysteine peptidase, partial [Planctomycetota bacterium]|nr:clostripain-related cysteine peptidase [Planctomycetota bacterium]
MTRGFRTVALAIVLSGAVTLPGCGGGGGGGGGASPPPPPGPTLTLSAAQLSFSGTEGGADPATQTLQITNSGLGGNLDWYAKPSSSWLTLDIESGTTPATLTVGAGVGLLPAGGYTGKIYLSSSAASTISFDVFFTVGGGASPPPGAQWTIMVYMDADNDLEEAALADMNEIEAAPPSPQVNVLALLDRSPGTAAADGGGYTNADGNWTETRRFVIASDSDLTTINSPFTSMGELNLGDPATLQTFLEWGIANYPASHYAVVIWGHGRSWITAGLDETSANDGLDLTEIQTA